MNTLPKDFWSLPDGAILSEDLRLMYESLSTSLVEEAEARNASTLELMQVQRVAFLYVWIRDRERRGVVHPSVEGENAGFANERNYNEINRLWTDMSEKVQKQTQRVDIDRIRGMLGDSVAETVSEAVKHLPKDVSIPIMEKVAEGLEKADI